MSFDVSTVAELYTPANIRKAMADAKDKGIPSVTIGRPIDQEATQKKVRKVKDADTNESTTN